MQDKAGKYVTAYTDEHGVKHIAPYYYRKRKSLLDETTVVRLKYKGTEHLENHHNHLAKTPSTERKGVC